MDELPNEARELLRLASDMHDPPSADARLRVRRGVAAAVATGIGVTIASQAVAQGTVKVGLFSGLTAKIAGAGMAVVVVSALAVNAPKLASHDEAKARARTTSHRAKHATLPAPAVAPPERANETALAVPTPEPAANALAPSAPSIARKDPARRHDKAAVAEVDGLRAETALLNRASQALSGNQLGAAKRYLAQHESEYRRSALREEREGLQALVGCLQNPAHAKKQGLRFVAQAPQSVLAQRVMRACRIGDKP